ncbi:DUF1471 domain-containing protein [Escherichia coli]|nr:DUF1471 domain-containing protein [Escherichia marmotae]EFO1473580.1 DUF1471 domain-containing protein [Escherichia coli]PSY65244.1 DUF1471 domain-containing protein [Escherichia sp. 20412-1]
MHVIDLSGFVKIHRSKNKHISVNFLRHSHHAGDLHLSGTTRCIYEDVIMKKCLALLLATVLSGITFTAYAAQPLSNQDSGQLRPAGTVSATGASNLSDLEEKLAEKAREQGAKGYVINSAGGNDQMFGTATIYK